MDFEKFLSLHAYINTKMSIVFKSIYLLLFFSENGKNKQKK